jgi:hypothetical protein
MWSVHLLSLRPQRLSLLSSRASGCVGMESMIVLLCDVVTFMLLCKYVELCVSMSPQLSGCSMPSRSSGCVGVSPEEHFALRFERDLRVDWRRAKCENRTERALTRLDSVTQHPSFTCILRHHRVLTLHQDRVHMFVPLFSTGYGPVPLASM